MTLAEYRTSKGLTLETLAFELGLKSKSYLSDIENGKGCSPRVAIAIEQHSGGLVDASSLSSDVALARAA